MKKPVPVSDVVGGILEGLKQARQRSGGAAELFVKLLDRRARSHIKPISLKEGELVVNVDSSAWLYTLNTRKPRFLSELRETLGDKEIVDLRFRIGEVDGKKSKNAKRKTQK